MLPLILPLLLSPFQLLVRFTESLLSGFQGLDAASVPVAMNMPELLAEALTGQAELELLRLEGVPAINEDQSALLYMQSCPEGRIVGCSFVVGEKAGAAFALTGTVQQRSETSPTDAGHASPPPPELLVQLLILDVEQMHDALEVELVYSADTAHSFADTVPAMLADVVEGWVGQVVDIREFEPVEDPDAELEREEAARELTDLEAELGEVEGSRAQGEMSGEPERQARPKMSHDDLLAQYEGKRNPWDEMEISSRQYLAWWNSGWDYNSWSCRFDGRKGTVLVRAHGGWGLAPTHGLYWGRAALDENNNTEELYAAQETMLGGSLQLGAGVGYGLTPSVEIELGVARDGGAFEADIKQQNADGGLTDRRVETFGQGLLHAWAGARVVPGPTLPLRPVLGAGVGYWMAKDLENHTTSPLVELPNYPSTHILSLRALAGAELRLHDRLDLVIQAPLHLLLGGTAPQEYREDRGILGEDHQPGAGPKLAGSLQLAVQARL